MKKLLLFISVLCFGFSIQAQDTISTLPTFTNNNGSSGVSLEVVATSATKIVGISNIYNAATTSTDVWIRTGGVGGPVGGPLVVNAANGWTLHQAAVAVTADGTNQAWLQSLNPITVPAGTSMGIVLTGGMRYFTATGAPVTTFPGTFATLNAGGPTTGFGGGPPPANLSFTPRGFLGSVAVELDLLGSCANTFTNVTTDSILSSSARVNWTPGTGNSSFWLEYGLAGFTPGSGTKITGSYPGTQPPVNLTGLSVNSDYDYYIGEICNSGADSIYAVSPYQFKTTKLCAPATNLSASNVLATSADISWSHAGGANSFTVYYGAGLSQTATSSPYTLTGLTSNTAYDIYVVADCGTTNGLSDSIGPVSFFTPCTIFTAPFTENFDGTTWVASGNNNSNSIDQCWSSSPATSTTTVFKWIPRSTGPTSGNGPLTDKTGVNFMYCEASGSQAGNVAYLTSPQIDASSLTTPALYFEQHRFSNATIADMQIEVSNDFGNTWDTVYSVAGDIQTSNSAPWVLEFVNLGAYTGDTLMVRFVQEGNGCCGDAAIDKVEIKEAPTCPWPTSFAGISTTSTSATVGWTDPTGTSWDLEWGPVGFTQGTGAIKTTSANPDTITGLAPDTEYDVYVRGNCVSGGNGFSIWIGPIQVRTKCSAFGAPYFNDFSTDIANTLPNCWSQIKTYGTGNFQTQIETEAFGTPYSTPNHLGIYNWTNFTATDVLAAVSPAFFDLTTGDKRVNFFAKTTWAGNNLLVGTTSDGVTVNYIDTIPFTTANSYQQYFIDLDSANGYNGVDNQVVFAFDLSNTTNTFDWIYIDDFTYEQIPACNPPVSSSLGAIPGVTTATVFWGAGSQGDATQVQWGTPNFMQGTGVTIGNTTVNGTVDTVLATGLMGNTQYEFWIRDSCNASGYSPWIGPYTFLTLCNAKIAPWTDNLDGSGWIADDVNFAALNSSFDPCWTNNPNTQTTPSWRVRTVATGSGSTGPSSDNTTGSANYTYLETSGGGLGDFGDLETPLVDVSSLTQPQLEFYYHMYGVSMGKLIIFASYDGGAWTAIDSIVGQQQTASPDPYLKRLKLLSTGINTVQIRFRGVRGTSFTGDMAIDDVTIEEAPTCPDPQLLNLILAQGFQATIGWDSIASATNGYNVEYGLTGFSQGTGGGTLDSTMNSSYTATGLLPVTCYDIYVQANCGAANGNSSWTGPYTFCTTVSCPAPSAVNATSITTTTATMDWTSGGASNYNYIIGPAATTTPATGTVVVGTTQPLVISGLMASTQYSFYIQDSCGLGDVSTWTGPYTFATLCNSFTMNYTEDFSSWAPPAAPLCWDDQGGTQVVLKNGNTAEFNFWGWTNPNDAILTSPAVTISQKARLKLSWSSTGSTVYDDDMYILAKQTSATVWDTIDHWNKPDCACGATNTSPSATPVDSIYSLDSNFVGSDIQVRLHGRSGWGPDVFIHSVTIEVDPAFASCPAPQSLTATNITASSADLGWASTSTNFEVSYGTGAFPANMGTKVLTSTVPYALTGLNASTTYGFYVRAICAIGDTSVWNGPFTFATACGTVMAPFSESFNTAGSEPACWTNSNVQGNTLANAFWKNTSVAWPNYGAQGIVDHTGGASYAMGVDASTPYAVDVEMETPFIDISSLTNAELKFWIFSNNTNTPGAHNEFSIDLYDGSAWNDSIFTYSADSTDWVEVTVPLSGYTISGPIQIRFAVYKVGAPVNFYNDILIDDISIDNGSGGGSCVAPTGIATSAVTCTDADLAWLSDMATLFTFVRYDTTGFDPATSGTLLINPTSPATLSGLMPGTTYDVYVADSCALGVAATMYTFTTPSAPLPSISYVYNQVATTLTSATVEFDASATSDGDTYSWDFGGGNTATGDSAVYFYSSNGSFPVTLTVTNGCGTVDSTFMVMVQGISVEESALGRSLQVFPNPNDGNFNVSFTLDANEKVELRVLNAAGQIVLAESLGSVDRYDGSIDLSAKAKGMYVLQIETSQGVINRRVTIQ